MNLYVLFAEHEPLAMFPLCVALPSFAKLELTFLSSRTVLQFVEIVGFFKSRGDCSVAEVVTIKCVLFR